VPFPITDLRIAETLVITEAIRWACELVLMKRDEDSCEVKIVHVINDCIDAVDGWRDL
jgi:hypothetical protein